MRIYSKKLYMNEIVKEWGRGYHKSSKIDVMKKHILQSISMKIQNIYNKQIFCSR